MDNSVTHITWLLLTIAVCGAAARIGKRFSWTDLTTPRGSPPEPPKHMTCVSKNYESMNCDWCPANPHPTMTIWKLVWTIDTESMENRTKWHNCTKYLNKEPGIGPCICHFCGYGEQPYAECKPTKLDFYPGRKYRLKVITVNDNGISAPGKFSVGLSPKIVKPDHVQELKTPPEAVESRSIFVQWKHPPRLEPDHFPLVYFINYSSSWNESGTLNTTDQNITLTGLTPFSPYNISVQSKPAVGGYLSDAMHKMQTTAQDKPSQPVTMRQGAFRVNPTGCNDSGVKCRRIMVYWKDIPKRGQNGIIISSTLSYKTPSGKTWENRSYLSYGTVQFNAELNYMREETSYSIRVIKSTLKGPSPPAQIFVDEKTKMPGYPVGIKAEYLEDGSGVNLIWTSPHRDVTGFTLHYCRGQVDKKDCKSDIQHYYISASNASKGGGYNLTLNVPNAKDYVYALSTERDISSSGMTQWLCIFESNGDAGIPAFTIPENQEERSLKVTWTPLTCDHTYKGRVTGYYVFWCEANKAMDCIDKEKNANVSASTNQYTIQNLEAYTVYRIRMAAASRKGLGALSDSILTQTVESKPEDSPWNVSIVSVQSKNITVLMEPSLIANGKLNKSRVQIEDVNSGKLWFEDGAINRAVVTNLDGYTNYSIQVSSCNSAGCSNYSQPKYAFTKVREPSQITGTSVKLVRKNVTSMALFKWSKPQPANGPISYYTVTVSIGKEVKYYKVFPPHVYLVYNATCSDNQKDVNFTVHAVNDVGVNKFFGNPSIPVTLPMCTIVGGASIWIIIGVGLAAAFIIIIIIIYACRGHLKRCYNKFFGKEKIQVPPRQQKIPTLVHVEADPPYLDKLPSPTASVSDMLISPDSGSISSGEITNQQWRDQRLPNGHLSSGDSSFGLSSGMRMSVGLRDTVPLIRQHSNVTIESDGIQSVERPPDSIPVIQQNQANGLPGLAQQPPTVPANRSYYGPARSSGTMSSEDLGYSQFATENEAIVSSRGYVFLPQPDASSSDMLDNSASEPSDDYGRFGVVDGQPVDNSNVRLNAAAPSVVNNDIEMRNINPQPITVGRVEIQHPHPHIPNNPNFDRNFPHLHKSANVAEGNNSEQKGISDITDKTQTSAEGSLCVPCKTDTPYVAVENMGDVPNDSDEHDIDSYSKVGQVPARIDNDLHSNDPTDKVNAERVMNNKPKEGLNIDTLSNDSSNKTKLSNTSLSIESLDKSSSANSSLGTRNSVSQSSSLDASTPTSGLGSKDSSMESMDNIPSQPHYRNPRRPPGGGCINVNSNNSNGLDANEVQMAVMNDSRELDSLDKRRLDDGYVTSTNI